jgi:hypothetical protein
VTARTAPAVLLVACLAAGCREPLSEEELRSRLTAQGAERAELVSFSAAYDLIVAGRRPDGRSGRLSCSGRIVAERGRGLRMQGAKALGMAKIFDFLTVGDAYKMNFIYGKKFYTGSVSAALRRRGIARMAGGEHPDLAALLLPVPPLEGEGAPELQFGGREARLVWPEREGVARRTLFIDAVTARPLRTEILGEDGRREAVIYYLKPAARDGLNPVCGFRLRGKARGGFRLDMKFGKIRLNGPVNPAAFTMNPPAGFEVIDVDARAAAEEAGSAGGEEAPGKR